MKEHEKCQPIYWKTLLFKKNPKPLGSNANRHSHKFIQPCLKS